MNKKIKVCVNIDAELNKKFKRKYPQCLSRYVERCIKDGLKDESKVLDSIIEEDKSFIENIFNRGLKK